MQGNRGIERAMKRVGLPGKLNAAAGIDRRCTAGSSRRVVVLAALSALVIAATALISATERPSLTRPWRRRS